jgi:hypothetical protein
MSITELPLAVVDPKLNNTAYNFRCDKLDDFTQLQEI